MYLRITQRHNRDGSTVTYYALAESVWNAEAKRREAHVLHSFGRADHLDRTALERLVKSINRVLDNEQSEQSAAKPDQNRKLAPAKAGATFDIDIEQVRELGIVLAARALWEELGIGPAIRDCAKRDDCTAPHELALFVMAANRLDDPQSKLGCATRWLPDIAWLPDAAKLTTDQFYRALDCLAVWSDEIERAVFLQTADLFNLDVDLIFYDTTTAYFEIDDPDEDEQSFAGRLYAPLRQRGHSKEGRDNQPQVIIALAVTRGGMPVKSWVFPGNTADVTTVARIKDDLRSLKLGRCVFVGDAGMYSAANLEALSRGLGRYILAVPMRKVKDVDLHVLTNRNPYKTIADNLQAKEVWVGDGERRKRYVLCLNPDTEKRDYECRAQRIQDLETELALLEKSKADHPKAACALLTSRRYGRYLSKDDKGRLQLDQAKISEAKKFDGKFVVISNDDTLSMEDIALGYKGGWIIESCFRRMKQTGLKVRPMFHWTARRIEAHVKLCVLALQMQRAAEMRCQRPWARIAQALGTLKAVRYRCESRAIVQCTTVPAETSELLKKLKVPPPKKIIAIQDIPSDPAAS
jgi:hypothetical protein